MSEVNSVPRPSARERLLAAANRLFYEEGIQTVGIDRVIEQAGVAKASLYKTFGSKDELIRAYLDLQHTSTVERIMGGVEAQATARDRILNVFTTLGTVFSSPDFHGCAFIKATAEALPGSAAQQENARYRAWVRGLFTDLARDAGVANPASLARQLHMLFDGSGLGADVERDPSLADEARAAAEVLVDTAIAQS
ncbi:TetR/AcrR family transcriptional regulator [Streptomyces sp. NBC_01498]|uniref:TetR/AcrR family transcriptional regulator n=1 Tax=Streptomyces sp. NBC_01498 TaxID=2975870 RepID=UPI002E7C471C|nr:TetR/AcrR family transcriptional regulator [Streptomyces sp. NBC_01498]